MMQDFHDLLVRLLPSENPQRLDLASRELEVLVQRLTVVLESLGDTDAKHRILAFFRDQAVAGIDAVNEPRPIRLTPEQLEWAKAHFNEEECLAGLREIQKTGGYQLQDFIHELEEEAKPRE